MSGVIAKRILEFANRVRELENALELLLAEYELVHETIGMRDSTTPYDRKLVERCEALLDAREVD